jgi:hypothetical protein
MAEKAKANIEEKTVPGNDVQKFVSKVVMELKVKRVTLFDKGGAMLLDIPKDNPAYQARAGRFAMPSLVNQLALIGTKHPEVKVKIERE